MYQTIFLDVHSGFFFLEYWNGFHLKGIFKSSWIIHLLFLLIVLCQFIYFSIINLIFQIHFLLPTYEWRSIMELSLMERDSNPCHENLSRRVIESCVIFTLVYLNLFVLCICKNDFQCYIFVFILRLNKTWYRFYNYFLYFSSKVTLIEVPSLSFLRLYILNFRNMTGTYYKTSSNRHLYLPMFIWSQIYL